MTRQVLVVRGAFAPKDQMTRLANDVPNTAFTFCDLSTDGPSSVVDFARRIDQHLDSTALPAVVLGVSIGGTIALSLRSQAVRGVIALDPILDTADCGALWPGFLPLIGSNGPFLQSCFGLEPERVLRKRYFDAALSLQIPGIVIVGSQAPRPDGRLPGLVSEASLDIIRKNPNLLVKRLDGVGHDIGLGGSPEIRDSLNGILDIVLDHDEKNSTVSTR